MRFLRASVPNSLLLALALPLSVLAQNVTVGVNATQSVRAVDERVFGVNSVIWDPEASTAQTISLVQAAGIRSIRVPGGSLSDEYHWRVNKTLTNTWTWSSHFGKFAQLISGANAQAMVTVNYGSGTPQEAAALVAYLNSPVGGNVAIGSDGSYDWGTSGTWAAVRASAGPADEMSHLRIGRSAPLGAKYFEIGNECYGTWEHDDQVGSAKNDPTTYANRAQLYMQAMRAVDPTIKIGVVVVTSGENNSYKNWTPVMLARLKVLNAIPDFIIYHKYPQAPGQESDATLLQVGPAWTANAADLRQQLTTHLGTDGAGVEIVVTENNSVYSSPGKQSTGLVNGLYLADSIASVMKTEINAFMWWGLRNGSPTINNGAALDGNMSASLYGWRLYGDYGMLSSPSNLTGETTYYNRYPTYYALKLLQYFARGGDTIVSATSNNNLLSVFAAKRANGSLTLFVINKDPANTQNAGVTLTGFTPATTATVYTYGKLQDDAAKPGGSGLTDIAVSNLQLPDASAAVVGQPTFSVAVGAYSATVIVLSPAPTNVAPQITTQPQNQTVTAGNSVTFTAAASGTPAPTFQWQKNSVNIPGATGSSLTIASVAAGDAGTYTVVATNSAGSVSSDPATLTLNQAPTASFSLSSERTIGQTITATVTVGDPNGNYSFANLWVNTPGRGWLAIKADNSAVVSNQLVAANTVAATAGTYARTFAFTPTDGAGSYTFALTAVDALGLQASASQTITVTANQAPTASFSLSSERTIGQTLTATVTVGDPDGNYSFANLWVNTPGRGWLAIKADNNAVVSSQLLAANTVAATAGTYARTFAFTPTDGAGSYTFALTAVDALGLQASASQTITVTANQAPTASFSLSSERTIGQTLTATVTVGDPDGNYSFANLWVNTPGRGWLAIKADNNAVVSNQLVAANTVAATAGTYARTYAFTPTDGAGSYTFALTAVDALGLQASASQTITVTANQAPTASFSLSSERNVGQTITATVTVGDPDGNYSFANLWVNTPGRGWLAIKADNNAVVSNQLVAANTVAATAGTFVRTFAFTPTDGAGSYTFALTAVDTLGLQASASQTITVTANQAPTASFSLSSERTIGQTLTATVTVGDPDGNYSFANLWVSTPGRGWVAIKADSSAVVSNQLVAANTVAATAGTFARTFAFTPTDGAGNYTFALTAVDTLGLQASASQTITVNPLVLFADDFSTALNTTNWVQQPDDSSGVSTWVTSAGELTGFYPLSLSAATNTQSFLLLGNARQPSGDWRASFDFTWVTDLSDGTFSSAIADFGLWLNSTAKLSISAGYGGVGASSAARSTINVNVQSWNGTSWSSLSSSAVNLNWTPASVNTAVLEKHGTVYHLLINNVEVLQFTDNVLNGQGKLGLHAYGTRTVDDFLLEQL